MNKTKIDWCDSTWNPVTGCLHGCEYCYARNIAHRFGGFTELEDTNLDYEKICESNIVEIEKPLKYLNSKGKIGKTAYPFFFKPTLYRYKLDEPQKWKKGRNIFVCSMADLFGSWVPDSWIEEVFVTCEKAPQHNYLFLTKNTDRYTRDTTYQIFLRHTSVKSWFGTTATRQSELNCRTLKLPLFKNCFLSIEPIFERINIEEIDIATSPVKWIIVGVETGRRKNKAVPKREWIEQIVEDCRKYDIPIFMKSSLADIWGEPLIQEFPKELKRSVAE